MFQKGRPHTHFFFFLLFPMRLSNQILFNEQMFFIAYQHMYAKPGNMTPGADGKTEDEMSCSPLEVTLRGLKNCKYHLIV